MKLYIFIILCIILHFSEAVRYYQLPILPNTNCQPWNNSVLLCYDTQNATYHPIYDEYRKLERRVSIFREFHGKRACIANAQHPQFIDLQVYPLDDGSKLIRKSFPIFVIHPDECSSTGNMLGHFYEVLGFSLSHAFPLARLHHGHCSTANDGKTKSKLFNPLYYPSSSIFAHLPRLIVPLLLRDYNSEPAPASTATASTMLDTVTSLTRRIAGGKFFPFSRQQCEEMIHQNPCTSPTAHRYHSAITPTTIMQQSNGSQEHRPLMVYLNQRMNEGYLQHQPASSLGSHGSLCSSQSHHHHKQQQRGSSSSQQEVHTIAIHFRCRDNFGWEYGLYPVSLYTKLLQAYLTQLTQTQQVVKIYILTDYLANITTNHEICGPVLVHLQRQLTILAANLMTADKTADKAARIEVSFAPASWSISQSYSFLYAADLTICSISTFCWFACLGREQVYLFTNNHRLLQYPSAASSYLTAQMIQINEANNDKAIATSNASSAAAAVRWPSSSQLEEVAVREEMIARVLGRWQIYHLSQGVKSSTDEKRDVMEHLMHDP